MVVGHSGGGSVAHAVVDARPERVARVVYVDSGPLGDGHAINPALPVVGGEVPLPDWSFFDDADLVGLDDGLRAAFRARAIPVPERVASDLQRLSDDRRRYAVPATVIACEFTGAQLREWMDGGADELAELARLQDLTIVDLPTGHWPQFTRSTDLAEAILAAVGRPTPGEVRTWHDEEGWGVVDSPATPGGCWTHFSHVALPGYRSLRSGQPVELEWEPADQDGYAFVAVRVWPRGQPPHDAAAAGSSSAYHSELTITLDEPTG